MHDPIATEAHHAKLLQFKHRQVLAYLYRDDEDALCFALQLWVAVSDEQHRAVIRGDSDDATARMFDDLNRDTLASVLEALRIPEDIEKLEAALA